MIAQGPDKPKAERKLEIVKLADGTSIAIDTMTGETVKNYGGAESPSSKIVKINGEDYLDNGNGTYSKPTLPDATPSSEKVDKANSIVTSIDAILNNKNLSKAIGPQSSRVPELIRSGARNDVDAAIDQLIAGIAIENLGLLKGPMSDKDVEFIKQASSGLKKNMSEQGFKDQLKLLQNKFQDIANKASSETSSGLSSSEQQSVNQMRAEGLSDSDIQTILGKPLSFNSPGTGNRPQRNNNPGNVKSSGVTSQFAAKRADGRPLTDEQGHLVFASAEDGWNALKAELNAKISGRSQYVKANPTLAQLGKVYAEDGNWARGVSRVLGVPTNTATSTIPFDKLLKAVATQEGFFA